MLAGPVPKPAEPQLSAEEDPLRVRLQLERVTLINLICRSADSNHHKNAALADRRLSACAGHVGKLQTLVVIQSVFGRSVTWR